MSTNVFKVVIIGGGASGLAAAKHFHSHGIKNIKVLEAQSYLGGRIFTEKRSSKPLEHGAHWIHGEDGNVVFDIAKESNLLNERQDFYQRENTFFVRENGEKLKRETVEKFKMLMTQMSEGWDEEFPTVEESVGAFYSQRFSSVNEWGEIGWELLDWQDRYICNIDGANSWYESSAIGQLIYKECPGNPMLNWKNGFDTLVNFYKENVPSSVFSLNSSVEKINWGSKTELSSKDKLPNSEDLNTIGNDLMSYNVTLDLKNNEKIFCEHVIITVSLGVLKNDVQNLFTPTVPNDKLMAIEGLSIDAVDKVYLEFADKWWPEDCEGFCFLHNKNSETNLTPSWEKKILGFLIVPHHPNMLCGWISGKAAVEMESESLTNVTNICVNLLRTYLKDHFIVPEPIWSQKTGWFLNPYIRGSYSFRSLKSEKMDVWQKDLAKPISNDDGLPIVCFGGEATHDCFYSTVHGAVESGIREAERIIKCQKT